MPDGCDRDLLALVGRRLPPRFQRRVVTVAPGEARPFDADDWRDAIVVVQRGAIDIEAVSGGRWHFRRGDVLSFTGLPLRALHNRGHEPAVLIAVSRRNRGDTAD